MELIKLVLIISFWAVALPSALITISDAISLVGVYEADSSFLARFIKMLRYNALLSFPFNFAFYFLIVSVAPDTGVVNSFLLALPLTLVALFFLRFLSNPNTSFLRPKLCKTYENIYGREFEGDIWDLHKERLLTFYFEFICGAHFILLVIWSNNVIISKSFLEDFLTFESVGYFHATLYLTIYISCLVLVSFIGEAILYYSPPIRTLRIMPKRAKAILNGLVLAESGKTIVLDGAYYFPPGTVKKGHLKPSNTHTECSLKGRADYYDIEINGKVTKEAAWSYPAPHPPFDYIKDYIAFMNDVMVV